MPDEIATQELIDYMKERGRDVSQKFLLDLARRGLLPKPTRKRRRDGARGTEGFWPAATIGRLEVVCHLRDQGKSYREIELALAATKRRLGTTIWLDAWKAARLEEISNDVGLSIIRLLQLGASYLVEAQAHPRVKLAQDMEEAFRDGPSAPRPEPTADETFSTWGDFIIAVYDAAKGRREQNINEGIYSWAEERARTGPLDPWLKNKNSGESK